MFLAVALQGVALSQEIPVEPINPSQLTPDEARATQAVVQTPTSNVGDVYAEKFQDAPSTIPDSFLSKVSSTWRPTQDFVVKPKDNIMIAVGQGLMNTISTNLTMLTAKTNTLNHTKKSNHTKNQKKNQKNTKSQNQNQKKKKNYTNTKNKKKKKKNYHKDNQILCDKKKEPKKKKPIHE